MNRPQKKSVQAVYRAFGEGKIDARQHRKYRERKPKNTPARRGEFFSSVWDNAEAFASRYLDLTGRPYVGPHGAMEMTVNIVNGAGCFSVVTLAGEKPDEQNRYRTRGNSKRDSRERAALSFWDGYRVLVNVYWRIACLLSLAPRFFTNLTRGSVVRRGACRSGGSRSQDHMDTRVVNYPTPNLIPGEADYRGGRAAKQRPASYTRAYGTNRLLYKWTALKSPCVRVGSEASDNRSVGAGANLWDGEPTEERLRPGEVDCNSPTSEIAKSLTGGFSTWRCHRSGLPRAEESDDPSHQFSLPGAEARVGRKCRQDTGGVAGSSDASSYGLWRIVRLGRVRSPRKGQQYAHLPSMEYRDGAGCAGSTSTRHLPGRAILNGRDIKRHQNSNCSISSNSSARGAL